MAGLIHVFLSAVTRTHTHTHFMHSCINPSLPHALTTCINHVTTADEMTEAKPAAAAANNKRKAEESSEEESSEEEESEEEQEVSWWGVTPTH